MLFTLREFIHRREYQCQWMLFAWLVYKKHKEKSVTYLHWLEEYNKYVKKERKKEEANKNSLFSRLVL